MKFISFIMISVHHKMRVILFPILSFYFFIQCDSKSRNNSSQLEGEKNRVSSAYLFDSKCKNWKDNMNDSILKIIFSMSIPISKRDMVTTFEHVDCDKGGYINLNDTLFKYEVNAASHFTLFFGDSITRYFGCYDEKCNDYFLIKYYGLDDEENYDTIKNQNRRIRDR